MSESWEVSLKLVDDSSRKFWRGRVEGGTLYINYGRIGTDGQTKVKELGDEAKARKELEKVAGSKRRKGYGDAGDAVEATAAAPTLAVVPDVERSTAATLKFTSGTRTIEASLQADGKTLKTEVTEHFTSDDAAADALGRARKALLDDGWTES